MINVAAHGNMKFTPSHAAGQLFHSFIPDVSIVILRVHYYSEALPTTALILCQS